MPKWRNLPAGRQVGRRRVRMFYVYALKSKIRNYIYVGLTQDISRRFKEHNTGKNKTTKQYRPFEIIYTEVFSSRTKAREKEKHLKSGVGKEFLKNNRN